MIDENKHDFYHELYDWHTLDEKELRSLKGCDSYASFNQFVFEEREAKGKLTDSECLCKAYLLENGIAYSINRQKASEYYYLAALKGDPYYIYKFVLFAIRNKYIKDREVRAAQAVSYLQDLVDYVKDSPRFLALCQYTLAYFYLSGRGVKKSIETAFHYYQLSFKNDKRFSAILFGKLHEYGVRKRLSHEKALYYYRMASRQHSSYQDIFKINPQKTWTSLNKCLLKIIFKKICTNYVPFIKVLFEKESIKKLIIHLKKYLKLFDVDLKKLSYSDWRRYYIYKFNNRQLKKLIKNKINLKIPKMVSIKLPCNKELLTIVHRLLGGDPTNREKGPFLFLSEDSLHGFFLLQASLNKVLYREKQSIHQIKGSYNVILETSSLVIESREEMLLDFGPEEKHFLISKTTNPFESLDYEQICITTSYHSKILLDIAEFSNTQNDLINFSTPFAEYSISFKGEITFQRQTVGIICHAPACINITPVGYIDKSKAPFSNRIKKGELEIEKNYNLNKKNLYLDYRPKEDYYSTLQGKKKRAEDGDYECQISTADTFRKGKTVKKSYELSFHYYKLAADQENIKTKKQYQIQLYVGRCFETGFGTTPSKEQAFQYYLKVANSGYLEAHYHVGRCYMEGIGIERNLNLAFHYLHYCIHKRFTTAQFYLAKCHLEGIGVAQSFDKCIDCMMQISRSSDKISSINALCAIAEIYEKGVHTQKDLNKAVEFYRKALNTDVRNQNVHSKITECLCQISVSSPIKYNIEIFKIRERLILLQHQLVAHYEKKGPQCTIFFKDLLVKNTAHQNKQIEKLFE